MIDLATLEQAAAQRSAERGPRLANSLARLERNEAFAPGIAPADGYARLAAATADILADPALALGEADADTLLIASGTLNALFAAAGSASQGAALAGLGAGQTPLRDLPEAALRRLLPLLTLDAVHDRAIEALLDLPPDRALLAALALIATSPVLTPAGAHRRERLLAAADRLSDARLAPQMVHVALASAAWMTCSYASGPSKHRLKPVLNGVFRRLLAETGFAAPPHPAPRALRERPTLVVIAEVMRSGHVQYRYFGQYLRQLATRFRLVLVAPEADADPAVRALFEEVFTFDPFGPSSFLKAIVDFVAGHAPDLVFWPSVGMARWGPLLANLRLAPIQFTALGHSASTFIPEMDYYLTEEGYVSDPALFSEKLLLLHDESLRFERPPNHQAVTPELRDAPDPLRIALPSNALKLNPGFLAVLQEIRARAARRVELHVFANAQPVKTAALRAASPFLGGAIVYPQMPASAYLAMLNQCDLVLSPFPFGGLHSVVDALRQGLPVVALEGAEPHARTDAMILRRLGMPERLIAGSEAEYVSRALSLIGDDAERLAIGRQALALDIDSLMFADATNPLGGEVVETVWAAYRNHERIMADPRRAWRAPDLAALG